MYFVVGKNGPTTSKTAQRVAATTFKPSHAVVGHFCPNPAGDAIFAVRFVAELAGMNHYLAHAASRGSAENRYRKIYKLTYDTP